MVGSEDEVPFDEGGVLASLILPTFAPRVSTSRTPRVSNLTPRVDRNAKSPRLLPLGKNYTQTTNVSTLYSYIPSARSIRYKLEGHLRLASSCPCSRPDATRLVQLICPAFNDYPSAMTPFIGSSLPFSVWGRPQYIRH